MVRIDCMFSVITCNGVNSGMSLHVFKFNLSIFENKLWYGFNKYVYILVNIAILFL